MLFEGFDSSTPSGHYGLWVTTGTAAGTQEIAGTSGLSPNDLTVFGGQVLFSGGSGLWATNGTAAGTHEVTSVAGAPGDLTVFGSEVLFAGAIGVGIVGDRRELRRHARTGRHRGFKSLRSDSVWQRSPFREQHWGVVGDERRHHDGDHRKRHTARHGCLQWQGAIQRRGWVVGDERAAGSTPTEISGTSGLNPQDMIVYNGEVLFNGADSSANGHGLWAWNGTSATELFSGKDPSNFAINNGSCAVQRLGFKWPCSAVGDQRPGRAARVKWPPARQGRHWLHLI